MQEHAVKTVKISEFKAKALAIMDEVARTGAPVLVTRRGKPLVKVEPCDTRPAANQLGALRNVTKVGGDIVSPVFDEWEDPLVAEAMTHFRPKGKPRRK